MIRGWAWRDEFARRTQAHFFAHLMTCWTGKGKKVSVNDLAGRPRFTRGWEKRSVKKAALPGTPEWEHYLNTLPPAARRVSELWAKRGR